MAGYCHSFAGDCRWSGEGCRFFDRHGSYALALTQWGAWAGFIGLSLVTLPFWSLGCRHIDVVLLYALNQRGALHTQQLSAAGYIAI